jgi:hypothetical protein
MIEYAALGFDRRLSSAPLSRPKPASNEAVKALLVKGADARECVRKYRLKKAMAETPPAILRDARLRAAMTEWLLTQAKLEAGR